MICVTLLQCIKDIKHCANSYSWCETISSKHLDVSLFSKAVFFFSGVSACVSLSDDGFVMG